ncbi:MAG TPA: hypothetical protein VD884_05585 [Ohtaekwangia sp.]|nr:hypothetical protein [Ohtaekwangia sp.]
MKYLKTIAVFALALLVLVSSSSFMVGIHFCQGEIKNVSFFSAAPACEKEQNLPPCHRHEKKSCCDDETIVHEGQDFKASVTDFALFSAPALDIVSPVLLISLDLPGAPDLTFPFYAYDPPALSYDRTLSHRVLLI